MRIDRIYSVSFWVNSGNKGANQITMYQIVLNYQSLYIKAEDNEMC